ncbi:hypothetical protein CQA53_02860 [Helicobacter didelphidarum]|uniref:Porin n=1 Tax=Helicobacter didelphidarum TaxID=2040648 RepID=A0A3D8IN81_9HELI|nr:hypothetical protein [Helicobacter didelphidarum]RDU66728.1 hypothetical protein CQA53_02860 [Helicobacter didelphidarum]
MGKLKKIIVGSVTIATFLSPIAAIEVYNNEEKKTKVDIYGSIRAYVGMGSNSYVGDVKGIFGLQTNSRFGISVKYGNLTSTIEFGAQEPSLFGKGNEQIDALGLRQIWGAYSFGKAGTLLVGKKDSPSVGKGFSSDIFDNDNGATGFGSIRNSNRVMQVEYSVAGTQIALVQDELPFVREKYSSIPRLALAYSLKKDTFEMKVGGSYKFIQPGDTGTANRFSGAGNAFHVFLGAKANLLDKKLFLSGIVHTGINADIYGEQRTNVNTGGFTFAHTRLDNQINTLAIDNQIFRSGALIELGYKISSDVMAILAVGYQATTFSKISHVAIHGYSVMGQVPIKIQKRFIITPQVSWYQTTATSQDTSILVGDGLMAFVQLRYDF